MVCHSKNHTQPYIQCLTCALAPSDQCVHCFTDVHWNEEHNELSKWTMDLLFQIEEMSVYLGNVTFPFQRHLVVTLCAIICHYINTGRPTLTVSIFSVMQGKGNASLNFVSHFCFYISSIIAFYQRHTSIIQNGITYMNILAHDNG